MAEQGGMAPFEVMHHVVEYDKKQSHNDWRSVGIARRHLEAALEEHGMLKAAFEQACTNLATIRPAGETIGDGAEAWAQALLAGKGGP